LCYLLEDGSKTGTEALHILSHTVTVFQRKNKIHGIVRQNTDKDENCYLQK
jgi:hypothetical protein